MRITGARAHGRIARVGEVYVKYWSPELIDFQLWPMESCYMPGSSKPVTEPLLAPQTSPTLPE